MEIFTFILSTITIAFAGTKLSYIADRLADRTGMGEAIMGATLLGASTSISGSTLSVLSSFNGHTDLAISNALGGIAFQTFFLFVADLVYRKSNLEHAAASSTNVMLSSLLIALLTIPLITFTLSEETFFSVHPMTVILFISYLLGLKYCSFEKNDRMWFPKKTKETVEDLQDEPVQGGRDTLIMWVKFLFLALLLLVSGFFIEKSGTQIAQDFGISHLLLGSVFTALSTSLPELITTLAAVKRGALTLAVGGIVGGNSFDVLFLAFSDVSYRKGSIYHVMTSEHISLLGLNILLTSVLLLGLIRREKFGVANIGWESILIAFIFLSGFIFIIN